MNEVIFVPTKLNDAVISIRKKCMLPDEVARTGCIDDKQGFVNPEENEIPKAAGKLKTLEGKRLKEFALRLPGRELKGLMRALAFNPEEVLKNKILEVAAFRMKNSIFEFAWILYQRFYFNSGFSELLKLSSEYMKDTHPKTYERSIAARVNDYSEKFTEQVLNLLVLQGGDVEKFYGRYSILGDGEFSKALLRLFFSKCARNGFEKNTNVFLDALECENDRTVAALLENYLDAIDVDSYIEVINSKLIEEYGKPDSGHVLWDIVDEKLKQKLNQWLYLYEIERHFGTESRAFSIWKKYYPYIKDVITDKEDDLIFINFDRFAVVDRKDEIPVSYLYSKETFKREYALYTERKKENDFAWDIFPSNVASARDMIIENINSDILRLDYEHTGILYIKEIIDIKLGLVQQQKKH